MYYWKDEDWPGMYIEFGTGHKPWYKRLWCGIKYIFTGHTGNMYDYAELDANGVMDLGGFCADFLKHFEEKCPGHMQQVKEDRQNDGC